MTTQELLDGKKWKEIHEGVQEGSEAVDNYFLEYNNGRELREEQVGNRADKVTTTGPLSVNKIPIPFQRKIVETGASFLFGEPIAMSIDSEEGDEDTFKIFQNQWDRLRLDSKLLEACQLVKSETRSAILFRAVSDGVQQEGETQDVKLRATVLSNKNGKIYPVFNEFGDMAAFIYEFQTKDEEGEDVQNLYIYDRENRTHVIVDGEDYKEQSETSGPHFFKRIPVVYFSQDFPDWYYVKELIDRYEMNYSKFADTNDYFASPFFKASGDVDFVLEKDNSGQVYKLDVFETDHGNIIKSDMDVISWDHAPESTKLEFETTKGLIYALTNTPDLSFDNVKGLGNISGIALDLMFLDPIIKAKYSEGIFKTGVERLINVLRAGLVHVLTEANESFFEEKISVQFQSVLPKNITEVIDRLSTATLNKPVMSQQTALEQNPLIDNVSEEMTRLQSEETNSIGETLNL